MAGGIRNQYGEIVIGNEVIARIAGRAAMECYGVVGMAAKNVKDGIARLLKKESLTKGIRLTAENNELSIDLHVIMLYGTSIYAICNSLIDTVKYKVEKYTGLTVKAVNVFVDGLRVEN